MPERLPNGNLLADLQKTMCFHMWNGVSVKNHYVFTMTGGRA